MAVRTGNWKQNQIIDGNGFSVQVGNDGTAVTGGGNGTVIDLDQPELYISVPSGTSIMPLRIRVDCTTPLINADNDIAEILIALDRTQAITNGTGTTETPVNMRTDAAFTSACTVMSALTGDCTDPVNPFSLEPAHRLLKADVRGTDAGAFWGALWEDYEPREDLVIVGPATLLVYWGGTVAVTGYCNASWIEASTSDWF